MSGNRFCFFCREVILIEGKLPSKGKVDFAEVDFDKKKLELLVFTSVEKKEQVDKTKAYKENALNYRFANICDGVTRLWH